MANRRFKQIVAFGLALTMTAGMGAAAAYADDGENIVLRFSWWGAEARHEKTLAAFERYHELHPNITIEGEYSSIDTYYQKLVTQFAGGTAPDIIQIDQPWIEDFAMQGQLLEDLNDYTDIIDMSTYDADYLAGWCMNGDRLEALPLGLNGYTTMYNKKALEAAGIEIDSSTELTWDDILTLGEQYKEANPDGIFLHTDPNTLEKNIFRPYVIQQYGGYFLNPDFTIGFTRESLINAYNYLIELSDRGIIQPLNETATFDGKIDQNPVWVNGQAALCIRWVSDLQQLLNDNVDIGVCRIPVNEGAAETGINCKPSMVATIYTGSEHKKEAAEFINWMVNDEEATTILADCRGVPPTERQRTQLQEAGMLNAAMAEGISIAVANAGTPQNGLSDNAEVTAISLDIIARVLYKQISPEDAADEMIQRTEEKLETLKNS